MVNIKSQSRFHLFVTLSTYAATFSDVIYNSVPPVLAILLSLWPNGVFSSQTFISSVFLLQQYCSSA